MKKFTLLLFMFCSLLMTSCELLGLEEEEEEEVVTEEANAAGYNYTFTCPAGSENTVPIPAAPRKCQLAYEYFARTYGCNEADYFNAANCKMCSDCGYSNYCSVCT